jgi:hypothetical protein
MVNHIVLWGQGMEYFINILHAAVTGEAKESFNLFAVYSQAKLTTSPFIEFVVIIRLCSIFHTPEAYVVCKKLDLSM